MSKPKIVILGGYGTFGSLIADQLASSDAQVFLAGRDVVKGQALAASLQVGFVRCDARSEASLRDTVCGTQLVINAAGPFQAKDYSIPQLCMEQGCHYLDLATDESMSVGLGDFTRTPRLEIPLSAWEPARHPPSLRPPLPTCARTFSRSAPSR
jgi:saccharopine dehydrogenase-like NADP-dependent oxidoreductase